jgi:uncharacterized protein YjbI with pentapeptide repeats
MLRRVRPMTWSLKGALAALAVVLILGAGLLAWLLPPILYAKINNEAIKATAETWTRIGLAVFVLLALGSALDTARRRWWLGTAGIIAGFISLVGFVLVVWLVPPVLYKYVSDPKERATAEASTRTGFLAGLVGLAALGGLAINARTLRETQRANRETHDLELRGQLNERYTKAIEELGSDKLNVRLGGIYALGRVARDSRVEEVSQVGQVLGAFIREGTLPKHRTSRSKDASSQSRLSRDEMPRLPTDVQDALALLGRLPSSPFRAQVDLSGAHLAGVFLPNASLSLVSLYNADLRDAGLSSANMSHAVLVSADLTDADLTRADLRSANLTGAKLIRARLWEASLADARLSGADLSGADLSGAELSGADLTRADLSDADLTRADLSTARLPAADLTRANLTGADLTRADLSIARLPAADLANADLKGADLTRADLSNARLTRARLADADLTDADLTRADLSNARLTGARLTRVRLTQANLTDADLRGADLTDADLTGAIGVSADRGMNW